GLPLDPLPVNLLAEDVKPDCFEAIAGIDPGPAPMGRAVGKGVAVGKVLGKVPGKILVAHTEHCANLRRATSTRYRCELFVEKAATRDQEQCNTCSDRK